MQATSIPNGLSENYPNAAKLIQSLRSCGYEKYSAICDILDNSIDAKASTIKIKIAADKNSILIADNGCGMDRDILNEALKLGSNTEKGREDLGKYGMGLVTASLALGRKVTVITKAENGAILESCQDIDQVIAEDSFIKTLKVASPKYKDLFKRVVGGHSGTVVLIEKIDLGGDDTLPNTFGQTLSEKVGRIFRKFIEEGARFYISYPYLDKNKSQKIANNELIEKIDPLHPVPNVPSEILFESTEEIETEAGVKAKLGITIACLPLVTKDEAKQFGINMYNQGFYLLRNGREITGGKNLGLFTKHNSLNRFRVEIRFNADSDKLMSVDFTKQGLRIPEEVGEALWKVIYPYASQVAKATRGDRNALAVSDEEAKVIDREVAQRFKAAAPLIAGAINSPALAGIKQPNVDKEVVNSLRSQGLNIRVDYKRKGASSDLFESFIKDGEVTVQFNTDHYFFNEIRVMDIEAQKAFKVFICSMAVTATFTPVKEVQTFWENMNHNVSRNLSVLYSPPF